MMQQHQHQKLEERSASGLEELIMGCTSTDMKEVSMSFLTLKFMKSILACQIPNSDQTKTRKTDGLKVKVQRVGNPTFLLLKDREIGRVPSLSISHFLWLWLR